MERRRRLFLEANNYKGSDYKPINPKDVPSGDNNVIAEMIEAEF